MTEGERKVWAAAFAARLGANLEYHNIPKDCLVPGNEDKWGRWELDQAADAAEHASTMVRRMRGARNRVLEGWGEDSATYLMLKEMLES